jgi:hypothetical protein
VSQLRGRNPRWPLNVVQLSQPAEIGALVAGRMETSEPDVLEEIVHPALSGGGEGLSRSGR